MLGKVRATTSPGLIPAEETRREAARSIRTLRRAWVRSNFPETESARRSGNFSATFFNSPVSVSLSMVNDKTTSNDEKMLIIERRGTAIFINFLFFFFFFLRR